MKYAYPHGAVILMNEKNGHEFKVNGQRVKHFYDQWQREDTTEQLIDPPSGGSLTSGVFSPLYALFSLECVLFE